MTFEINFVKQALMEEAESGNFLRDAIRQAMGSKFETYAELAAKANVNQGNLSSFMNGKRETMTFESAWQILKFLGFGERLFPMNDVHNSLIRRVGSNSPVEKSEGGKEVPVYEIAGAGAGFLPENLGAIFNVGVPPDYSWRANYAIYVRGHSMEPLIPNGAIVGIRENEPFQANEIYLAHIPDEGLVIKRVGIDHSQREFVFKSQNPDKEAYPDFRVNIDENERIIIGRVVWIMVRY